MNAICIVYLLIGAIIALVLISRWDKIFTYKCTAFTWLIAALAWPTVLLCRLVAVCLELISYEF